jgi:hypothetical protein
MRSSLNLLALALIGLVPALPEPTPGVEYNVYEGNDVIRSDACIIGGGSGGTYAVTRLRQLGPSIIVVKKEPIMGGHTNTYTVPGSGLIIDYEVLVFHNISIVRDYFAHYNVALPCAGRLASLLSKSLPKNMAWPTWFSLFQFSVRATQISLASQHYIS